jgi:hypothetical protein
VAGRVVERHEGAVVLREERRRVEPLLVDDGDQCTGGLAGDAVEGGVEHSGVLALQQAERADLVAERDRHVDPEVIVHERGDLEFLVGERGAEDAAHRDRVEAAVEFVEEAAYAAGIQRRDGVAVDEVPAAGASTRRLSTPAATRSGH